MQTTYILIMIISLALIGFLFWVKSRQAPEERKKPSNLALAGMLLVVMAIIFSGNRLVGYFLIGIGVGLAVIDLILTLQKK
jgi:asparagine N-glycosylation enzyme membrane subunit Stt3